jgi:AcrR family transcriptional regulator
MTTTPATKRGPYARSQQRREQVAAAVLELVDELGLEGVTTAAVATRSGINEATVLYHFPTKDHLLVAGAERADELSAAGAHLDEDDVRLDLDALRDLRGGLLQDERRIRLFQVLKGQASNPEHPAAAYIARRNERTLEIYTRLIARRQADGIAHPGLDPAQVALQVFALWEGLTALWLLDPSIDVGKLLVDGIRRLTGEPWMNALATLTDPATGL